MQQTAMDLGEPRIVPARRIVATADAVMIADGDGFVTRLVDELQLDFEGVPGDRHRGWLREADSRTPWYRRGTPIRNVRQVSVLSPEELSEIALRMDVPEIKPEWLGGNIVLSGISRLSRLPAGTTVFFPSGASLRIEQINGPCRFAGASVAEHYPGRTELDLLFPKAAVGLRGVVASVELAGIVRTGDAVKISIPEQWIWEG